VGAPPAAPARDQPAHCSLGAHHEGAGARGAGTSTACWLWTRAQLFTTCGELHKEYEVLCS